MPKLIDIFNEHRAPSLMFRTELPTNPKPVIKITPEMFESEPTELDVMLNRKVQAIIKLDIAIRTLEHGHKLLTEAAPEFNSPALFTIGELFSQQIQILKGALK